MNRKIIVIIVHHGILITLIRRDLFGKLVNAVSILNPESISSMTEYACFAGINGYKEFISAAFSPILPALIN